MKWQKYAVSVGALLLLTALCMLLPNLHTLYTQVNRSHATVAPIDLTVPQPTDLSAAEVLRVLCDVGPQILLIESGQGPTRTQAVADCRQILNELLGQPQTNGEALQKVLSARLDAYSGVWIESYTCVALYNGRTVRFRVVSARFEDLCVLYEPNSHALIELALTHRQGVIEKADAENEYTSLLYQTTGVHAYYAALGLQNWEYDTYAYNNVKDGNQLFVGIRWGSGYISEEKWQS